MRLSGQNNENVLFFIRADRTENKKGEKVSVAEMDKISQALKEMDAHFKANPLSNRLNLPVDGE